MGKRAKGAPAPASVQPMEVVEAKPIEKKKEKKADGKKGALSRFGVSFLNWVSPVLWLTISGYF